MRKRTIKLRRLSDDGRKLFAGTIEAADPRELVMRWCLFLATAERTTEQALLTAVAHLFPDLTRGELSQALQCATAATEKQITRPKH